MATAALPLSISKSEALNLAKLAVFTKLRVLAWDRDVLYASRGYELLRTRIKPSAPIYWEHVAFARPPFWRRMTSSWGLAARLFRDGFHALAVLDSGELIAAIPKAIVTLSLGDERFRVTHRISRGTRPLHFAVTPNHHIFWGAYFDNPRRDEVHIYVSQDRGIHWEVAYTFAERTIRHVHNIVYDEWEHCLWVMTGDSGLECRIIRASCDFRNVEVVLSGNQQARAAAAVTMQDGLYFSSDTPIEQNHVYHLDRRGNLTRISELSSSSIYGCRVGDLVFFSTMVEPSAANRAREVRVYGSADRSQLRALQSWRKDPWPMKFFQYGNVVFPDGTNHSGLLALTTVAVTGADGATSLWQISQ
jgi:hypothetical protein